jgi:hypothetical protein
MTTRVISYVCQQFKDVVDPMFCQNWNVLEVLRGDVWGPVAHAVSRDIMSPVFDGITWKDSV